MNSSLSSLLCKVRTLLLFSWMRSRLLRTAVTSVTLLAGGEIEDVSPLPYPSRYRSSQRHTCRPKLKTRLTPIPSCEVPCRALRVEMKHRSYTLLVIKAHQQSVLRRFIRSGSHSWQSIHSSAIVASPKVCKIG